jgi:hypothetical protein
LPPRPISGAGREDDLERIDRHWGVRIVRHKILARSNNKPTAIAYL